LTVAVIVFVSETVDAIVPVAMPFTSVTAPGCVSALPVPVEAICTFWPGMGVPALLRTVTVTVERAMPFDGTPVAGLAVTVERLGSTLIGAAVNTIVGCCATAMAAPPGSIVAVIVFVSASVDAIVPVATPPASVVAAGCVSVFDEPLEASWTV
jgi:hypothetical protein